MDAIVAYYFEMYPSFEDLLIAIFVSLAFPVQNVQCFMPYFY